MSVNCTLPEEYQGYPGIVHGGIVAAMLDEAAGRAHMDGERTRFMFTARLNIQYRKNVPVGKPIRLVGKSGETKRRTAKSHAYIYDEHGTLLAEAEAILVDVPAEMIQTTDLESLGWKVYPE